MTDGSSSRHGGKMSPDLKRFRAFARALFGPAKMLAILGSLGGLAVAGFGQFECAESALIPGFRPRDYIITPVACLFVLGMMRQGGYAIGEKRRWAKETFDLYDITLIEVSSMKISFAMLLFVSVMLVLLVMLCIPIGVTFINLKSIWVDCVIAVPVK